MFTAVISLLRNLVADVVLMDVASECYQVGIFLIQGNVEEMDFFLSSMIQRFKMNEISFSERRACFVENAGTCSLQARQVWDDNREHHFSL
ncbi:hypothetical protein T02_13280 [Trichinella nativa]|uniref:Uncharacterized protein n=1 Tax=Trichinella nativa TaxID=6335 RepID=A0A0V1LHC4_9BILA|nr:hypothetical protein T02_13280 [Trichinella nativa]